MKAFNLTKTIPSQMGSTHLGRVLGGVAPPISDRPFPPPDGREMVRDEANGATPLAVRGTLAFPDFNCMAAA